MTNLSDGLDFNLLTSNDLENSELAQKVIDMLLQGPEFLKPKRFGVCQPLNQRVDPKNIQPLIDLWMGVPNTSLDPSAYREGLLLLEFCSEGEFMVHWRKGGHLNSFARFHSFSGGIPKDYVTTKKSRLSAYLDLISELTQVAKPVYGTIRNSMTPYWDAVYDLTIRLPDVPWGSIFGAPYIEMWGREKILKAPFHYVEELPSGHIFAQLTDSILDPHLPEDRREAVREYFGEEYFMKGSRTYRSYKTGKSPKFD